MSTRSSGRPRPIRIVLIDLHRLKVHRLWPDWWRWKDLGQLLFSTYGVAGIDDRDRLRFWRSYRKRLRLPFARWQGRLVDIPRGPLREAQPKVAVDPVQSH